MNHLGKLLFSFSVKPVMGCDENFQLMNAIEALWDLFKVVNLTYNHIQGNDKPYANRIRVEETTKDDIKLLSYTVMSHDNPNLPKEALYVTTLNADVNRINDER